MGCWRGLELVVAFFLILVHWLLEPLSRNHGAIFSSFNCYKFWPVRFVGLRDAYVDLACVFQCCPCLSSWQSPVWICFVLGLMVVACDVGSFRIYVSLYICINSGCALVSHVDWSYLVWEPQGAELHFSFNQQPQIFMMGNTHEQEDLTHHAHHSDLLQASNSLQIWTRLALINYGQISTLSEWLRWWLEVSG